MKKPLVIFLAICSIALTCTIQAENLEKSNSVLQNTNSVSITVAQELEAPDDLNAESPLNTSNLLILAIIGFFFARKHQSLAKKHQNQAKKKKNTKVVSILIQFYIIKLKAFRCELKSQSIFYPPHSIQLIFIMTL